MKAMLEHRRKLKARKPTFTKQDAHKKPGIAQKWSRPRGIDSKMRLKLKGYRRSVEVGWKSPQEVRFLDRSGLKVSLVHNTEDAEKLDPKTDGLIISGTVGMRKKIEIIRIAQKLGMRILNVKDPDKFVSETEKKFESRKKEKKEKEEKKQQAKKKEEKKLEKMEKEKQEKKEESKTVEEIAKEEEERQEKEKIEKDKILTKRE